MKPRILDCTFEDYLADNIGFDRPSLNSSIAKILLTQSAAHAAQSHPRLGAMAADDTKQTDAGSVIHSLLLNAGKPIHVINFDNYRTKAAQMERDSARDSGAIPMLVKEAESIQQAAMAISRSIASIGISMDGKSEFGMAWESDACLCRRSLDKWNQATATVLELKSTFSAHPSVCSKQSYNLGYDLGYAASLDGLQLLYPELAGRIDYIFVFFELEPPYAVYACRPTGEFKEYAYRRWQRAKLLWSACIAANDFPAYSQEISWLDLPPWAMKQLEEGEYETNSTL